MDDILFWFPVNVLAMDLISSRSSAFDSVISLIFDASSRDVTLAVPDAAAFAADVVTDFAFDAFAADVVAAFAFDAFDTFAAAEDLVRVVDFFALASGALFTSLLSAVALPGRLEPGDCAFFAGGDLIPFFVTAVAFDAATRGFQAPALKIWCIAVGCSGMTSRKKSQRRALRDGSARCRP